MSQLSLLWGKCPFDSSSKQVSESMPVNISAPSPRSSLLGCSFHRKHRIMNLKRERKHSFEIPASQIQENGRFIDLKFDSLKWQHHHRSDLWQVLDLKFQGVYFIPPSTHTPQFFHRTPSEYFIRRGVGLDDRTPQSRHVPEDGQ
ncbi:hypothetical protein AVEN_164840-1 [Araneus ventricosus]|uniref:Uncharacterized protein n=1 Tax=Araneus ventricosus TaxID=182803 RepID=A0A4Y2IQN3_ARAVE|nr:hypothetical protein AVEN_164840-1 [Araneus ventricosus]